MIDLTKILIAVLELIVMLIAYKILPVFKARLTTEQQKQWRAAIRVAIFAAEQIFGAGHGSEKLDFAIKWLKNKGYDVDRTEIEAAVYEELNFLREVDEKPVETPVG